MRRQGLPKAQGPQLSCHLPWLLSRARPTACRCDPSLGHRAEARWRLELLPPPRERTGWGGKGGLPALRRGRGQGQGAGLCTHAVGGTPGALGPASLRRRLRTDATRVPCGPTCRGPGPAIPLKGPVVSRGSLPSAAGCSQLVPSKNGPGFGGSDVYTI